MREGLVSKIYLIAFEKYRTAYAIAKELGVWNYQVGQEVNERFPNLFNRRRGREKKKPLHSEVGPFLRELEEGLAEGGVKPDSREREQLREYLDGLFRRATAGEYLEVDYSRPIDAYSELLGLLLVVVRVESRVRRAADAVNALTGTPKEELRINYRRVRQKILEDLGLGAVHWADDEVYEPVAEFSDELLDKLREVSLTGSQEVVRKYNQSGEEFFTRLMRLIKNQDTDNLHSRGFLGSSPSR